MTACSTLVYSRVLITTRDLDTHNANIIRAGDDGLLGGPLALETGEPPPELKWYDLRKALSAAYRFMFSLNTETRAFWKAERWLRKGRPVVIAASENPPEERGQLPDSVICFDQRHSA